MTDDDRPIVMVTGSRSWRRGGVVKAKLRALNPKLVMHGGARGADELAQKACDELGIATYVLEPLWAIHGKAAGVKRNEALLAGEPDVVLAFWDGSSPGTGHAIKAARRRGIRVELVQEPTPPAGLWTE